MGIMGFRTCLQAFYKTRHSDRPLEKLTRVHDVTIKMVGSPDAPNWKFSGAETWGILLFLNEALHKHAVQIGLEGKHLLEMGKLLENFVILSKQAPMNPPLELLED